MAAVETITAGTSNKSVSHSTKCDGTHWQNYGKFEIGSLTATNVFVRITSGIQACGYGYQFASGIMGRTNFVNTSTGDSSSYVNEQWTGFTSSYGSWDAADICTGSLTITRTKVDQTWQLYTKTTNATGYDAGSAVTQVDLIVPKLESYSVTYNANNGSGAPSTQTKWYGENLTLSSTKPTRTGYIFQGWGTSASTSTVSYKPGATYSSNAALTLYAVWKAVTYSVTFDANGGTNPPSAQTKTYGVNLTLSSTKPTRTGYIFQGWGTSATATKVAYSAGATYSANAAIKLYAIWKVAYVLPRITNVHIFRCTSDGTADSGGEYASVSFNWATDYAIKSISVKVDSTSSSVSVTSGAKSGAVSKKIFSGCTNSDSAYTVVITVTDSYTGGSNSASYSVRLAGNHYLFDVDENGNFAIGGVSSHISVQAVESNGTTLSTKTIDETTDATTTFHDRVQFSGAVTGVTGVTSNTSTWKWKEIARATKLNTAGYQCAHITGFMGGTGSYYTTPVDIFIGRSNVASNQLTVPGIYSATDLYTCASNARIVYMRDSNGYGSVWVAMTGWAQFDFICQLWDMKIVDGDWQDEPTGCTVLYNSGLPQLKTLYSNSANTNFHGRYPTAVYKYGYGPGYAYTIYPRYISGNMSGEYNNTLQFTWGSGIAHPGGLAGDIYKEIYSGNWSVGATQTSNKSSDFGRYDMLLVKLSGFASLIPCYRNWHITADTVNSDTFGGMAAMPAEGATSRSNIWVSTVRLQMPANNASQLKYICSANFDLGGTTYNANKNITNVYGVI